MSSMRIEIPRYPSSMAGLPGPRVFTLTNSERGSLVCPRQWFHGYGERLEKKKKARPLSYGDGWARAMEDWHRWLMVHDRDYPLEWVLGRAVCPWCSSAKDAPGPGCGECEGTGRSIVWRIRHGWKLAESEDRLEQGQADQDILVLSRALRGYGEVYGLHPDPDYRVVGVEMNIAVPVVNPKTGRPYRPRMPLSLDAEGFYRLPRPGEWRDGKPPGAMLVEWPFFQVCKLDAVLQHRRTGALWVKEIKSSSAATSYLRHVSVDPQTDGYSYALKKNAEAGNLPFSGDVAGVLFDVASSNLQLLPQRLKDKPLPKKHPAREQGLEWKPPQLSRAQNRTTPSWLYREAIQEAPPTSDGQRVRIADYLDHLQWCRSHVDSKLYIRESLAIMNGDSMLRYQDELYGIAKRISSYWRALAKASCLEDIHTTFPRVPVCRKPGGFCTFIGPCMGTDEDTAFTPKSGPRWYPTTKKPADETAEITEEEVGF